MAAISGLFNANAQIMPVANTKPQMLGKAKLPSAQVNFNAHPKPGNRSADQVLKNTMGLSSDQVDIGLDALM